MSPPDPPCIVCGKRYEVIRNWGPADATDRLFFCLRHANDFDLINRTVKLPFGQAIETIKKAHQRDTGSFITNDWQRETIEEEKPIHSLKLPNLDAGGTATAAEKEQQQQPKKNKEKEIHITFSSPDTITIKVVKEGIEIVNINL